MSQGENGDPDNLAARNSCGAPTTTGSPCQRGPNCPYHQQDDPPDAGRPTKLTRERQECIAGMLEEGHSIAAAARANGISHETYHDWVRKGSEQEEGIYAEFAERMTRARAEGERRYIEEAQEAAIQSKNAQALLRMAQLQYPDSWGENETGAVGSKSWLRVVLTAEGDEPRDERSYKQLPDEVNPDTT